jgi:hypothetical protein
MSEREIKFWQAERMNDNPLTCESIDEAVGEYVEYFKALADGKIEIIGYAPMEVNPYLLDDILENILERLDEEYGNPDNTEGRKPTEEMKQAEAEFVKKIISFYEPWMCEEVERKTINVKEWIEKNKPERMEEKGK